MFRIQRQTWSDKLSALSALPRDALFFLAASFVNSAGMAIMWPLTTFYVHNVLGQSYGDAGMVVFFQSLLSTAGQFVGGQLYYRLGPIRIIAGSFGAAAVILLLVASTESWPLYVLLLSLFGFANGAASPAMSAYVGFRWQEHRRSLYNVMYVCNNVGISIGAAVGGWIAAISFSLTYALTGATTFVFAIFLFVFMRRGLRTEKMRHLDRERGPDPQASRQASRGELLRNVNLYLYISLGALLYWIAFQQWSTGVAPYMEENGLGMDKYSLLWTVNGLTILLGQPLAGWIRRRSASMSRHMLLGSLFTMLAFVFILALHDRYGYLVIGMIVATIGEMLLLPVIPMFFSERTGVNAPFYMGLSGGFGNVGRMLGPLMFGHMFDWRGVNAVFMLGTLTSVLTLLLFYAHHLANREKERLSESAAASARQSS